MLSARNRELLGLVPAALLVTAGFLAIFIQAQQTAPVVPTNPNCSQPRLERVADLRGDLPRRCASPGTS